MKLSKIFNASNSASILYGTALGAVFALAADAWALKSYHAFTDGGSTLEPYPVWAKVTILTALPTVAAAGLGYGWQDAKPYERAAAIGLIGGFVAKAHQLGVYAPLVNAIF